MADALKSFLAGWAGGVGILAVGHPFDTVKTLLQDMPRPKPGEKPMYTGAMDVVRQTVKKGGPLALYRGVIGPFWGIGPVFALYFLSYDTAEKWIRKIKGYATNQQLSLLDIMICGGFTGVVGTVVLAPAELIKIRQQTAISRGIDGSFAGCCKKAYSEGGVRGFYKGSVATLARDVPGSMGWFGAYEVAKMSLCEDPKNPTVLQALLSGGCGGLGMWLTALPMDTIKTRIQASPSQISWANCARSIFKEGGVKGFYAGFAPIMLRAFPANASCFACKEYAKKGLDYLF
eukprot:NODE_5196_length_1051_cov_81.522629_g4637_i0.p1 GENE.NODE_5196_length_1051_cov_81.522629_g4637_i0~~NODE_5196_length_1051_cov_81.522629_g4637_i0.p1  ORF type:complete len:307 (-),score=54.40 NODE_5196_length_1051_cov_81.522629_g4637_i0:130-996(-)